MPHLSPLSWSLASIILWFSFLNIMSMMWWNQTPSTMMSSIPSSYKFNKWNWN